MSHDQSTHPAEEIRVLERIDDQADTREILALAKKQAIERKYEDYVIVDADCHNMETASWVEILEYVEDPVIRQQALDFQTKVASPQYGLIDPIAYHQDVGGRIRHQRHQGWDEAGEAPDVHRDIIQLRRSLECIGIDYSLLFPTGILSLGMHPQTEMEVLMGRAYNRWMVEKVLPGDDRIKALAYLPFSVPDAAVRTVEEFADKPGVVGFLVTSVRNLPVHDDQYMKLYAALEERDMPLTFHGGYSWHDPSMGQFNRFIGVHAVGMVFWNAVHLTNWVVNGIPERFPNLDVVWIESGLAWAVFLMQRLDGEYMKRTSEAPLLKKKPSEYIREMFFTTQPLEMDDLRALEFNFEMLNAETQVLYASDWFHWDFDLPSTIFDLPFLSERARRNILGESALKLFRLEKPRRKIIPADDWKAPAPR